MATDRELDAAEEAEVVLRPWAATFADPELETAYLRHRVAQSGRTLGVVAGVCAAIWLVLIPTDWSCGLGASILAGTTRLVAAGLLGTTAVAFWHRAGWVADVQGRRLLTAATVALAASFLVIAAARQGDSRHLDLSAVMFGTAILLFAPIPLRRRTATIVLFYVGFWWITTTDVVDAAPARLATNLLIAVVGGVACAVHLERSGRRSFLLLRWLHRTNGDLSAEVTHHLTVQRSLVRLAAEDELTGLMNRRAFFTAAREAVDRDGRATDAGAAFLVDADRFKAINDEHGHEVGDRVLQGLASTLAAAVREGDIVARLGGEEFAVYLPGAGPDEATVVAERIRSTIADCVWAIGEEALRVTVSVGVAMRSRGEPIDDALRRADAAMYRSKRAGGDRLACDVPG